MCSRVVSSAAAWDDLVSPLRGSACQFSLDPAEWGDAAFLLHECAFRFSSTVPILSFAIVHGQRLLATIAHSGHHETKRPVQMPWISCLPQLPIIGHHKTRYLVQMPWISRLPLLPILATTGQKARCRCLGYHACHHCPCRPSRDEMPSADALDIALAATAHCWPPRGASEEIRFQFQHDHTNCFSVCHRRI